MELRIKGHPIVPGKAEGTVICSHKLLSFWGGVNPETGVIIDPRHDLCGRSITGKVLILPGEKGSSTASAVLVELIRNKRAPAALIVMMPSPILALGAIVAEQLYGKIIPILIANEHDAERLMDGDYASIDPDGIVLVRRSQDS